MISEVTLKIIMMLKRQLCHHMNKLLHFKIYLKLFLIVVFHSITDPKHLNSSKA